MEVSALNVAVGASLPQPVGAVTAVGLGNRKSVAILTRSSSIRASPHSGAIASFLAQTLWRPA
jgi:hypothetical protein